MIEYKTQMEAAKKGIVTPQMKTVAEKEGIGINKLLASVACGEVAIPANINHKSLSAEGIGAGLKTKNKCQFGHIGRLQKL